MRQLSIRSRAFFPMDDLLRGIHKNVKSKLDSAWLNAGGKGLEVVAVALDTPEEEWNNFIHSKEMGWINVTDEDSQAIYDHYSVWAIPEIMLLGPGRPIIGKHLEANRMGVFK